MRSRAEGPSGLGLSIAQRHGELLGASIEAGVDWCGFDAPRLGLLAVRAVCKTIAQPEIISDAQGR